ncbi:quinone-dependent dihydroorotate dehydrogenase [Pannus brasiliensis CCIBt3594]|uniref:Dihydroorotate dehydrogenase (quinone) n=1 Tax=Pannus brasiliensis CCIBt3594 TaxID=1427578 RepID=A0AAW9QP27_9CHRO
MPTIFEVTKPLYPIAFSAIRGHLEEAHQVLLDKLNAIDRSRHGFWGAWLISQLNDTFQVNDPRLAVNLWGLSFPNPLGLAAGFDKNGLGAGVWDSFGFGFAEVGAVTLEGQPGNPTPRLFRLPDDRAALNRMGANNRGAAALAETLQACWRQQPRRIPIGINLCKSKNTPLEAAPGDYLGSFRYLFDRADYFVVNVSSPNTPGLRSLQSGEQLDRILDTLQTENQGRKPLLVKISPDLALEEIKTILELSKTYRLAGIVATNTTIDRSGLKTRVLPQTGKSIEEEAGGISGRPLRERSTEIIRFIYRETRGELPIIGVGGIFSIEDVWEKITAGASLLQVYTGWLYQGPWMVPTVLKGLGDKLAGKGFDRLASAVGSENPR